MGKSKYTQLEDGDTIVVDKGASLNFACCACGLIHNVGIKSVAQRVTLSFGRDERKTAAYRREKRKRGEL